MNLREKILERWNDTGSYKYCPKLDSVDVLQKHELGWLGPYDNWSWNKRAIEKLSDRQIETLFKDYLVQDHWNNPHYRYLYEIYTYLQNK